MSQALPDDLLEEIFLRLPPAEPKHLVRASLSSKLWLGLLTGVRFRSRYGDRHGAPPMLGFLYAWPEHAGPEDEEHKPHFMSITKFVPRVPDDDWNELAYAAWDCRHGCDHRACHEGRFRVVFVSLDKTNGVGIARAGMFSMDKGGVSKPCSPLHLADGATIDQMPSVLVQDALHFMVRRPQAYVALAILKYDLSSDSLSLIDMPSEVSATIGSTVIMAMQDGSLGIAGMADTDKFILHLWSRRVDSQGVATWTQCRVVDLKELLPIQNTKKRVIRLIGSVEGSDLIFVTTDLGIYEINLKSLR